MKIFKFFVNFALPLFIISFVTENVHSQIYWEKYENNPVLNTGEPGSWESNGSGISTVIHLDGIYKAWYTGINNEGKGSIGYATSADGITWSKYENNPVLIPGDTGEWDSGNVSHACVLYVEGAYRMWYTGEDDSSNRIGYAFSADGINWDKYNENPVMDLGPSGSWDESEVMHASVRYEADRYQMWYNGYGQNVQRIGYATSSNGINWTKYSANPVMTVGPQNSWDEYMLALMSVIFEENEYKIWYTGGDGTNEDNYYFRIGYADSPDGKTWLKSQNNPVVDIGDTGSWDSLGVITSCVLFDPIQNKYKMWYGGFDGSHIRTGYAVSDLATDIIGESQNTVTEKFKLFQNYPNPFNPDTKIAYSIFETGRVQLKIFDVLGTEIATILDEIKKPGRYEIIFNTHSLSSGIYYYRLQAGNYIQTKKMILVK